MNQRFRSTSAQRLLQNGLNLSTTGLRQMDRGRYVGYRRDRTSRFDMVIGCVHAKRSSVKAQASRAQPSHGIEPARADREALAG